MTAVEDGALARIEAVHLQLDRIDKRFERFENRFDAWVQHHDDIHGVLLNTQSAQGATFGAEIAGIKATMAARTLIMGGWNSVNTLLSALLAVLGMGRHV